MDSCSRWRLLGFCTAILALFLAAPALDAQGITDANGYITSDNWLALGPFANPFGCSGSNADIVTFHVAPSSIQCQWPEEGDAVPYDPDLASTDGVHPKSPIDGAGNPTWYVFQDGSSNCDLDMDANTMLGAVVDDHNLYVATYVEYLGASAVTVQLCGNSDDGLQVWLDDQLVINNNACRGRGACAAGVCNDVGTVTVTPGCHRILMGVWERGGGFGGSLRLRQADGVTPILDGSADWTFHGVAPCGPAPAACAELATRTVAIDCPDTTVGVTIQQDVPPNATSTEVVTVVETVAGAFGPGDVTVTNGATVTNLASPPLPVGQFDDHRNVVVTPVCSPDNGDTVEGPAGTYTMTNTGADIWTAGDTFQYAYNVVRGDFDVSCRIVDRTPVPNGMWGKLGIMVRQTLEPTSRYSWTHDTVGDASTATGTPHHNDTTTYHSSRPNHLGAGNFNQTPYPANPSGDGIDDYCDGIGPDDGTCTVVHDDYLRLVRTGSLVESYSRANPTAAWTLLGSHDWGADIPGDLLVGLAVTSHSTDCNYKIEAVFDQVDFGTATIIPIAAPPKLGVRIEWNVTRQQLAAGIGYTVGNLLRGDILGFDGTVDGVPVAGYSATVDICTPMTNSDGTFKARAFLAYGPFGPDVGFQLPCGGSPDLLRANWIYPENIQCFAPKARDEFEWDPVRAESGQYFGPLGRDDGPVVRRYGGTLPNLDSEYGGDDRMQWMITYLEYTGNAAVDAELCISTDDSAAMVLDGEFVHANNVCRGTAAPCAGDIVPVTIEPGPHVLKFASFDRGGGWGLDVVLRVGGVPVLDGDPDWIFHGTNRPGEAEDYPCTPSAPPNIPSVACVRNAQGGANVTWTLPQDLSASIDVSVNGVLVGTVSPTTTSTTIPAATFAGLDVARICVQPQGALSPTCCGLLFAEEVFINCGGLEVVDTEERVWREDSLASPSPFLSSANANAATWVGPADLLSDPTVASEAYPEGAFLTERWADGPVEYTVWGLDDATTYTVTILFMEACCSDGCLANGATGGDSCLAVSEDETPPFVDPQADSSTAGCRVFDIYVNDAIVRDQFSQNALASCLAGTAPGPASYLIGVSVRVEDVLPENGAIKVRIADLGSGTPPENASIKGVAIVPSGSQPPVAIFRRGDADAADGVVNITDAIFVLNYLFQGGDEPPCLDAADADNEFGINITDGIYILSYLFLGGPAPPAPGPDVCGPDPALDPPSEPDPPLDCKSYPPGC